MTFQPVVPLTGYPGWKLLQRTLPTQLEAFSESASVKRDTDAFKEKIGFINSAEELMEDRQLLRVALGAFGLDDDINNTYFINKVLTEGTEDDDALANKMSDKRYEALAETFGFGNAFGSRTWQPGFADKIINKYENKQFQQAVGDVNGDMRLALNLAEELSEIAAGAGSEDTKWFKVMGSNPVRKVFETALGFPSSFGAIDVDLQLEQFKQRSKAMFGTSDLQEISGEENQEKLIRLFLVRSEAASFSPALSSAQTALTLLSAL